MAKLVFSLLLVSISGGVGLAAITAWLHYRLLQLGRDEDGRKPSIIIRIGMVITNGVLIYALVTIGKADPNWRSWFYVLGVVVMTVGFGWEIGHLIRELAATEARTEVNRDQ